MEQNKRKAASVEAMCVLRHTTPILCPICSKPTVSTWDSNYRNKSGQLLFLRGCPECDKVFTPELILIPELTLVQDENKK